MQHRGQHTTMEAEGSEGRTTPPPTRGRHNSKLKVLVRSHAMREETSPPREPSPNHHLPSPSIKVIPSPISSSPEPVAVVAAASSMSPIFVQQQQQQQQQCTSPISIAAANTTCNSPIVVLSPSGSPHHGHQYHHSSSPNCISPTSTLVPSPVGSHNRCSAVASPCSPQRCSGAATAGGGGENETTPTRQQQHQQQQHQQQQQQQRIVRQCGSSDCCDDFDWDEECEEYDRSEGGGEGGSLGGSSLSRLNKQNLEESFKRDAASHNNRGKKYICDCTQSAVNKCLRCERNQQDRINVLNNNHSTNINNNVVPGGGGEGGGGGSSPNTLSVNRAASCRGKLRQQSSSQGSFEGSSSNSPCLSRDSSSEQYTDTTGIDLEAFISETLNRNFKDQNFMLRIEKDLVSLAKNKEFMFGRKTHYKFPPMSSYRRMLVHRCAAYFGMDHNIESTGKCVVVNKTKNTRIPEMAFKEHIKEDNVFTEEPRRSILKRDSNSIEDYNFKSPDRHYGGIENRRSKSYEERAEQYDKAKKRIFSSRDEIHDVGSNDDFEWTEIPWSSTESDTSSRYRLQLPEHNRRMGKLIKVLSEETGEPLRPCVAKSYSFGGYGGGLNRGDSLASTHSAGPRLLTKQDSGASSISWRLSPSSSGYKSQSQLSESVTPSPSSTPHPVMTADGATRLDSNCSSSGVESSSSQQQLPQDEQPHVVWAVTDIQSIPIGSCIIDPKTCSYIKNDDGSLYHYDPHNPPPGFVSAAKPPLSPKKSVSPQRSSYHAKDSGISIRSLSPPPPPPPSHQSSSRKQPPQRSYSTSSKYSSPIHQQHHHRTITHQLTNSSTSPSLPYSPPLPSVAAVVQQQQSLPPPSSSRNFQFVSDLVAPPPPQHQYAQQLYSHPGYAAAAAHSGQSPGSGPGQDAVYQQPCIMYTTQYGMPHFDGRLVEAAPPPPPPEGTTYFVNVTDGGAASGQIAYQQQTPAASYWNPQQPITFYQNPQSNNPTSPPHQRYSQTGVIPVHGSHQTGYVPATAFAAQNFMQPSVGGVAPQPPPGPDLVPVFPTQMVYTTQPNAQPPNALMYSPTQSGGILYTHHNPAAMYSSPIYPTQNLTQYQQNTSTPNSCASSASHPSFVSGHVAEHQQQPSTPTGPPSAGSLMHQVTQGMAQLPFQHPQTPQPPLHLLQHQHSFEERRSGKQGSPQHHQQFHYDVRPKRPSTPNKSGTGMKFGGGGSGGVGGAKPPFSAINSSQSSTDTNSPAATVVSATGSSSGFCQQNPGLCRTPSETPPHHFGYGQGFHIPPMVFRQLSQVRANTPGTSRSSRSPTPIDISHFERQRMALPPALYHGMPYLIQADTRIIPGRGQPNAFRHPAPARQNYQSTDNRYHKNRKSNSEHVTYRMSYLNA